uniref:translation initiation factor eIF-2B subunit epsilon-like n=1 Tax=Styela clava TaxID=7725 RepID=UPI00193A4831|nr:translation initiation factor eIF-2B subunit epsilon-like [Styela clava]
MPSTKKGKPQGGTFEQENVLQAVVVADRFDEKFQPLSDDIPLALFPLANKPLLDYTLDFLSSNGVQQIYVYCCHCSGLIKDYIANSKWGAKSSQCRVTPIVSSDFTSLGDVLRDIDQKSLFETDFLLVAGDLISNMSLQQALTEHRDRRTKDKNKPLMTLILRSCPPTHEMRSADDDIVVALDSHTQQVLYYQKIGLTRKPKFEFPLKTLLQNTCSNFEFRYDLSDAGVAVCSPQVPQLFTDNFDYQTKEDFIKGILINEEFLGNQIHIHTIKRDFAARISTLHMYDTISKAVTSRWIYPYVPDNDFESGENSVSGKNKKDTTLASSPKLYHHLRRNVYIGSIKSLGKDSSIEDNCVIGHDTIIGNNCRIRNSVVGNGCVIGDDVSIKDSYLWSGVTVKDKCTIDKSILSNNSIIHENTKIPSGCVLATQVEIGPNITLKDDTVIHIEIDDETFAEGENMQKKDTNPSLVGERGRGILWSRVEDIDSDMEDEDVGMEIIREGIWGMSLTERDKMFPTYSDAESSEDDDISTDGSDMEDYENEENSITLFFKEVKDSLSRGIEESIKCDNLILEINSSKYAYNVTIQDVIRNVTKATFEISYLRCNDAPFFPALKKVLLYMSPVFMNYNKTSQSQMECINEIEQYCLCNKHAYDCLIKILMLLYENDILAEEVILSWHKNPSTVQTSEVSDVTPNQLRKSVTKFIDWLQEAEEESSSEDDSS